MNSGEVTIAHDELGSAQEVDLLRVYLNAIGRVPLLQAEQEVELAQTVEAGQLAEQVIRVRRGDREGLFDELYASYQAQDGKNHRTLNTDPRGSAEAAQVRIEKLAAREDIYDEELVELAQQGKLAFDQLVSANLRLVVSMAIKNTRRGLDILDVIQFGNTGLMHAVEKFDYAKGFKFSTYASNWIRQAINAGIPEQGRTIRLPRQVYEQMICVRTAMRQLTKELGREPTLDEVARHHNLKSREYTALQVGELLEIGYALPSFDELADEDTPSVLRLDRSAYSVNAESEALRTVESEELVGALKRLLTREELEVFVARHGIYGAPQTHLEIGARLGISDNAVRRLVRKASDTLLADEAFRNQFGPQNTKTT